MSEKEKNSYKKLNIHDKRRFRITFFAYAAVTVCLLLYFTASLLVEKKHARDNWASYLYDPLEQMELVEKLSVDATEVSVGTYIENLRELNLKGSYYRIELMVWFNWEGDADLDPANHFRVYKGLVNKMVLVEEEHIGNQHYQLVGLDVSVSKNFDTKRFPLESHQLRFYIESTDPVQEVVYVPDYENSGINENITLTGFRFMRHDIGAVSYTYDSTHGDPSVTENEVTSEIVTAFEINRSDFGLYFKCFIALAGTVTWVLIALFICSYHHVDPLSMIPAALFGTVGNIMIGAALVPDALQMGLLEYVNLWGVLSILGGAIAIININRVRKASKEQENQAFAYYYGRMLFYTMLVAALSGQVILPIAAYIW
ncbi:hypothetical protein LJC49_02000 [Ruminococcaceae bacterium OttesenSCG-928-I18]|nr:hypothetical protein [Ruminococcaceae bacterium OttesenSCG-928-I18]